MGTDLDPTTKESMDNAMTNANIPATSGDYEPGGRLAGQEAVNVAASTPDAGQQDSADDTAGDDYDDMTVDDLKDELEDRGLPRSGSKSELIARLRDDDA